MEEDNDMSLGAREMLFTDGSTTQLNDQTANWPLFWGFLDAVFGGQLANILRRSKLTLPISPGGKTLGMSGTLVAWL